jgi:lipid-binding SYLF domain-containing protein
MRHVPPIALALLITLGLAAPCALATGLQDDVNQAVTILERFQEMPEKAIPEHVMKNAKGLAILTAVKAGFIFSGQAGKGLVVARTAHGWTGPSAIGTGSAGFGLQAGVQVAEFVIVLNTDEAVKAFSHGANVKLGADISAAAGPIGRAAGAGVTPLAAVYTYSRNQGLFAGVSLDGTVMVARNDANKEYYGRAVTPQEILTGKLEPPPGAEKLIAALNRAKTISRSSVRDDGLSTQVTSVFVRAPDRGAASSRSRSASNFIDPFTSANRTVTCLRSPSSGSIPARNRSHRASLYAETAAIVPAEIGARTPNFFTTGEGAASS